MYKYILFILTMVLLFFSCMSNGYNLKQRRFYNFESSYNKTDTMYLSDFIFYNLQDLGGLNNYREIYLNEDSLFSLFKISINKLDLPLIIADENKNLKTTDCIKNPLLKYKKIKKDSLFSIANKNLNKLSLVPIIYLNYTSRTHITISGADPYPHYLCFLNIALFVISDNKVIYFKNMYHVEIVDAEYHPYKFEDFHIPIPQEHWDGLVREVMREYIERMK